MTERNQEKPLVEAEYITKAQGLLARWQSLQNIELEKRRFGITLGQFALKAIILINGGAAVAMLAFLGHIWNPTAGARELIPPILAALTWFVSAVAVGGFAAGLAYVTQFLYSTAFRRRQDEKPGSAFQRWGRVCHAAVVLLCTFGLVAFVLGVWEAISGFRI